MDCREQGSDVAASQQNLRVRGDHAIIKFFQQVIAAIAATHPDERCNVLSPPEFMKFVPAPVNASRKVKIALKNILRINWLVSHLAQTVATRKKSFTVEAAGRSDKPEPVTLAQSGRPNDLCRSADLCVSQGILPGRSVLPGHANRPCHLSNAPPACPQRHAPSPATLHSLRR